MMLPATLADDAPHLLVVDDDRRIRDLLSRFLSGEGYRVTTAETAMEARAKLNGLSFDLLILDVMMPGRTGWEVARALKQDPVTEKVKIVMLTAIGAAVNEMTSPIYGADAYIDKPFDFTVLETAVAKLIG